MGLDIRRVKRQQVPSTGAVGGKDVGQWQKQIILMFMEKRQQ